MLVTAELERATEVGNTDITPVCFGSNKVDPSGQEKLTRVDWILTKGPRFAL